MKLSDIKVYALILNYNCAAESLDLYLSLKEYDYPFLKILIIDNNSAGEDLQKLKQEVNEEDLLLNSENLGYAGGNNKGIEIALHNHADYVWILNPDIRILPDSLEKLLNAINADSSLAAVGPRILKRENPEIIFSDGELLFFDQECTTKHKNHNLRQSEVTTGIDYKVDYIDGSCILINTKAIEQLGQLPLKYFLYFEETHWCARAKEEGWKLAVNTNASVYNYTSKKGSLFHFYFMRNKIIFCKRFHPSFKKVYSFYGKALLREAFYRLKGDAYLKPYYFSRVRGYFAGLVKSRLI